MGKLIFRYGTMNAAKSAHLLMTGFNFLEQGLKVEFFKPTIDTRDEGYIRSRAGLQRQCWLVDEENDFSRIIELLEKEKKYPDVILVDEVQFLSERLVNQLSSLATNALVICYGLRTDSNSRLFEGSKRLFEICDTIEELKSCCSCGHKAIFNGFKYPNGKFGFKINSVRIGGNETYEAVCRECYNMRFNVPQPLYCSEDCYTEPSGEKGPKG